MLWVYFGRPSCGEIWVSEVRDTSSLHSSFFASIATIWEDVGENDRVREDIFRFFDARSNVFILPRQRRTYCSGEVTENVPTPPIQVTCLISKKRFLTPFRNSSTYSYRAKDLICLTYRQTPRRISPGPGQARPFHAGSQSCISHRTTASLLVASNTDSSPFQ
jgi:hypothetical protein